MSLSFSESAQQGAFRVHNGGFEVQSAEPAASMLPGTHLTLSRLASRGHALSA